MCVIIDRFNHDTNMIIILLINLSFFGIGALTQSIEPIRNVLGGVYTENVTLFFRNSPYRVQTDLTVEVGSTMTIETGVQLYFDSGVGLRIKGSLYAVVCSFLHI